MPGGPFRPASLVTPVAWFFFVLAFPPRVIAVPCRVFLPVFLIIKCPVNRRNIDPATIFIYALPSFHHAQESINSLTHCFQ